MENSILTAVDSYKIGAHWNMYPEGTTGVYSYFESRTGAALPYTVFFGLQYILRKNLTGQVVTQKKINQAAEICLAHFGTPDTFNKKGWEYILRAHDGRLPLRIKAVPEGLPIPTSNILMSVENTDEKCPWLTNYVESLLTHVWYPSSVASLSHSIKTIIREALEKSSDSLATLNFMLHDFGMRSNSSNESAEIGGAAHLINFLGTDSIMAIPLLAEYYNNGKFDNIAFSVPASEHSIGCSLGRDGEIAITRQLIEKYPKGVLSVVADSYDIYNFVSYIVGTVLKDEILARDGVFVVRPDSVTPTHTNPESEMVWILNALWDKFGGSTNSKGFRVLNPRLKTLWGDGIDKDGIQRILNEVIKNGYSVENIATFGMGSGLIHRGVHRDWLRFAFKSSWQKRNGVGYDIFKQPLDASKASKKGRMKLVYDGQYSTVPESDPRPDVMQTVFLNGKLMKSYTLEEVRKNAS